MNFFSKFTKKNQEISKDFGVLLLQTETSNFILREQIMNLDSQIQLLIKENTELKRQLAHMINLTQMGHQ